MKRISINTFPKIVIDDYPEAYKRVDHVEVRKRLMWLTDSLGPPSKGRWYMENFSEIVFNYDSDYTAFLLRWS